MNDRTLAVGRYLLTGHCLSGRYAVTVAYRVAACDSATVAVTITGDPRWHDYSLTWSRRSVNALLVSGDLRLAPPDYRPPAIAPLEGVHA